MAWELLLGQVWACNLHPVPDTATVLEIKPFGTSGLTGFYVDTNGDGVSDLAFLFQKDALGDLLPWPLFYFEGMDRLGRAEEVWIDTGDILRGEGGQCRNFRLYYKRTVQG